MLSDSPLESGSSIFPSKTYDQEKNFIKLNFSAGWWLKEEIATSDFLGFYSVGYNLINKNSRLPKGTDGMYH